MNGSSVYSKTGKGMLEASGKSSILSRADRAVLAKVDGKSSVTEINKHFEKIEETKFQALLQQFEKDGFVREVASSAPPATTAAGRGAASPAPAQGAAADPDEDLDFTALAAAAKKSAAPAAAKRPVDLAAQA